mmetsp:Transcript_20776/g.54987  ORF Transcript_20776/g.54987 Transcript_20776/m.54987 type:complete len:212 (+) Transcript_20776:469-1104(+)
MQLLDVIAIPFLAHDAAPRRRQLPTGETEGVHERRAHWRPRIQCRSPVEIREPLALRALQQCTRVRGQGESLGVEGEDPLDAQKLHPLGLWTWRRGRQRQLQCAVVRALVRILLQLCLASGVLCEQQFGNAVAVTAHLVAFLLPSTLLTPQRCKAKRPPLLVEWPPLPAALFGRATRLRLCGRRRGAAPIVVERPFFRAARLRLGIALLLC